MGERKIGSAAFRLQAASRSRPEGTMSDGAYAPDKAAAFPDRIEALRRGEQIAPVHLHLILSDLCNLDCPLCAYRSSGYSSNQRFGVVDAKTGFVNHNPIRMLPTKLVLQTLDEFKEMGGKAVEFTGGGEPTLHPSFAAIVWHAQQIGLDTALVTNGIGLQRKLPPELLVALKWLRISIDAVTRETYGKVRPSLGGPHGEMLDSVLRSLQYAATEIAASAGPSRCTLGAGFVVQKENWQEIVEFVRVARAHGAHNVRISGVFTVERDRYFDGWSADAELEEQRAVRLYDVPNGFRVYGRLREKIEDLAGPPDFRDCHYEQFTTYLAGDGNLYRCCVTSYNDHGLIGNVAEAGGFRKLWESEHKRQRFATFDARSCAQCQFRDRIKAIDRLVQLGISKPVDPTSITHASFV
jgi:radical SAM protein with 4Fe4S-binding SPASM domain